MLKGSTAATSVSTITPRGNKKQNCLQLDGSSTHLRQIIVALRLQFCSKCVVVVWQLYEHMGHFKLGFV